MNLPPPPKELAAFAETQARHCALNDMVQAYGQQCRAAALEEAAKACESRQSCAECHPTAPPAMHLSEILAEKGITLQKTFVEKPRDHIPELNEAQQVAVPAGYALVPIEPTPAILDAMSSSGWKTACYKAMLEAAQGAKP